ncbi:hypothetical protein Cni_G22514 [Canna indica]|uniref:Uncharacterized protein n=1 Tax=Canna indica TaxID=4628 RepID=A0AAQ3KWU7_9LILI|nr:hypothetical protein Cni_G22514 [Canna indica]
MDEEMPLIFEEDEEVPIISEVFETELLKEREFVLHELVEGLPPAREESEYKNEVMEEPNEEETMEVEEGSLQQQQDEWMAEELQPRRATPMAMIWPGFCYVEFLRFGQSGHYPGTDQAEIWGACSRPLAPGCERWRSDLDG